MENYEDTILTPEFLESYFTTLVNYFFKILPLRENNEDSISVYAESLQTELLGCKRIVGATDNDSGFMTLLCILQNFIDNPDYPVAKTKREVFKAINVCNRMKKKYGPQSRGSETK